MTNETNVEWLERVKNIPVHHGARLSMVNLQESDLNRLIKQAERAQELEDLIKSHAPEGRNYTNEQYVGLIRGFTRLEEALEFYADKDNYSKGHHDLLGELESGVEMDEGLIARQALKEEEDK